MVFISRYEVREVFTDPVYCIWDRFLKVWYKKDHQSVSFKKYSEARIFTKRLNQQEKENGHLYWIGVDGSMCSRLKKRMVK